MCGLELWNVECLNIHIYMLVHVKLWKNDRKICIEVKFVWMETRIFFQADLMSHLLCQYTPTLNSCHNTQYDTIMYTNYKKMKKNQTKYEKKRTKNEELNE